MRAIRVLEERAHCLVLARDDRFAVVGHRAGNRYNLLCGRHEPKPLTGEGAGHGLGHR